MLDKLTDSKNYQLAKILTASGLLVGSSLAVVYFWKEKKIKDELKIIEAEINASLVAEQKSMSQKGNGSNGKQVSSSDYIYPLESLCKLQSMTNRLAHEKYIKLTLASRKNRRMLLRTQEDDNDSTTRSLSKEALFQYIQCLCDYSKEYIAMLEKSSSDLLSRSKNLNQDNLQKSIRVHMANEKLRTSLQNDVRDLKAAIPTKLNCFGENNPKGKILTLEQATQAYHFILGVVKSLSGCIKPILDILIQNKSMTNYYFGVIQLALFDELNQSDMFNGYEEEDLIRAEKELQLQGDYSILQLKATTTMAIFELIKYVQSQQTK